LRPPDLEAARTGVLDVDRRLPSRPRRRRGGQGGRARGRLRLPAEHEVHLALVDRREHREQHLLWREHAEYLLERRGRRVDDLWPGDPGVADDLRLDRQAAAARPAEHRLELGQQLPPRACPISHRVPHHPPAVTPPPPHRFPGPAHPPPPHRLPPRSPTPPPAGRPAAPGAAAPRGRTPPQPAGPGPPFGRRPRPTMSTAAAAISIAAAACGPVSSPALARGPSHAAAAARPSHTASGTTGWRKSPR